MVIYIEGVDGSGKTTLKNKLAERLNQLATIKSIEVEPEGEAMIPTRLGNPNRVSKQQLSERLLNMLTDTTKVFLLDRGPISDVIYRTFDNQEPVLSLSGFQLLNVMFGRLMVIVHCDSDKSEELMKARGEDNPTSLEHHKQIRYLYQQIMPIFNAIEYDMSNDQETINLILAQLWLRLDSFKSMQKEVTKQ